MRAGAFRVGCLAPGTADPIHAECHTRDTSSSTLLPSAADATTPRAVHRRGRTLRVIDRAVRARYLISLLNLAT